MWISLAPSSYKRVFSSECRGFSAKETPAICPFLPSIPSASPRFRLVTPPGLAPATRRAGSRLVTADASFPGPRGRCDGWAYLRDSGETARSGAQGGETPTDARAFMVAMDSAGGENRRRGWLLGAAPYTCAPPPTRGGSCRDRGVTPERAALDRGALRRTGRGEQSSAACGPRDGPVPREPVPCRVAI